jgi:hypothetical protein
LLELGLLLYPTSRREYTYIRILTKRHSDLLGPPTRCIYVSAPPNGLGLLFMVRAAKVLGDKNVDGKCVAHEAFIEKISPFIKKCAESRRLSPKRILQLQRRPIERDLR